MTRLPAVPPAEFVRRTPRPVRFGIAIAIGIVVAVSAAVRFSPIRAVRIVLDEARPWSGPLAPHRALTEVTELSLGNHNGPEDVALAPDGRLVVGCEDGILLRVHPHSGAVEVLARTDGRPLGLKFAPDGALVIADAYRGLLSFDGRLNVLATRAGRHEIGLADDLDVAADGSIYFSDASTGWTLADVPLEMMEGRAYGRLARWRPGDRDAEVLVSGLAFANGVALAADESYVLVSETFRHRVLRHWLKGAQAGRTDVFVDRLPGLPDGIARASDSSFWIALVALRDPRFERLADLPMVRTIFANLPRAWWPQPRPYGLAIHVSPTGDILESLHDPTGRTSWITNVVPTDHGTLYFGSLHGNKIGVLAR